MTFQSPTIEPGAPGALRTIQDFINTPRVEPTPADLAMAEAIRQTSEQGVPQATLAARHGVSQQLVSAILRRKRLVPAEPDSGIGYSRPSSLGTPESARAALVALGLLDAESQITGAEHARILETHRLLLALALGNNEGQIDPAVAIELTALATSAPLAVAFDSAGRSSLQPTARGADAAIARLLAIIHDAMRESTWSRLKVCPADRCEAAFYDTSRNRSATWCSMSICGNRAKVSSYQRRRRNAHAS